MTGRVYQKQAAVRALSHFYIMMAVYLLTIDILIEEAILTVFPAHASRAGCTSALQANVGKSTHDFGTSREINHSFAVHKEATSMRLGRMISERIRPDALNSSISMYLDHDTSRHARG